jgi:signal peptidase I
MNKDKHKKIIRDIGFSLLSEGKVIKIRADGYSMYPSVKPGSIVHIQAITEDTAPIPGEIVVWKRKSKFIVHRLIRIIQNNDNILYVTRGDSCSNEDAPDSADKLVGKVIRIEDPKGYITTGNDLIRKPDYLLNRSLVRILIIFRKLMRILH